MPGKRIYTISDLTQRYDISARTIRFYEEKGLLFPRRTAGNQRRYTNRDRRRLKWILRGKRFGYSLGEVAKILEMVDAKTSEVDRIRTALGYGRQKLADIENQLEEMTIMHREMKDVTDKLEGRLEELMAAEKADP